MTTDTEFIKAMIRAGYIDEAVKQRPLVGEAAQIYEAVHERLQALFNGAPELFVPLSPDNARLTFPPWPNDAEGPFCVWLNDKEQKNHPIQLVSPGSLEPMPKSQQNEADTPKRDNEPTIIESVRWDIEQKCPGCGGRLRVDPTEPIFDCLPPIVGYKCEDCGKKSRF